MKHLLILFISFTYLTGYSQSQSEMNDSAHSSYIKVEGELNDIYNAILNDYKSDTLFIQNLKASQCIWINLRDAELKVKYSNFDTRNYGTVYPMCYSIYMEILTRERINTLKEWIEGIEEGDVCIGSVKMKKNK